MSVPSTPQLVQPIVVLPGDHFETITAVAIASGLSLVQANRSTDPWASWLSGSFTKSVRRVKTLGQYQRRIVEDPDRGSGVEHRIGEAIALALEPQLYEDMPRSVRSLQVSGLDLPGREGSFFDLQEPLLASTLTATIQINQRVTMTTGKTAAQVAHALCAWLLTLSDTERTAWANHPGVLLSYQDFDSELDAEDGDVEIEIRDNGLTEVAPGTTTVRVRGPIFWG